MFKWVEDSRQLFIFRFFKGFQSRTKYKDELVLYTNLLFSIAKLSLSNLVNSDLKIKGSQWKKKT